MHDEEEFDQCLCCGSGREHLKVEYEDREIRVPFSDKPVLQRRKLLRCDHCNEAIVLDSEKQDMVEYKIYKAGVETMPEMLDYINKKGYSDSRIERAFDLSKGTVASWKKKLFVSREVLALVRYIRMIPELIKVAEGGYDLKFTEEVDGKETVEKCLNPTESKSL